MAVGGEPTEELCHLFSSLALQERKDGLVSVSHGDDGDLVSGFHGDDGQMVSHCFHGDDNDDLVSVSHGDDDDLVSGCHGDDGFCSHDDQIVGYESNDDDDDPVNVSPAKDLKLEQEKADMELAAQLQEEEDRDFAVRISEMEYQCSRGRNSDRMRQFSAFTGIFPSTQTERADRRKEGRPDIFPSNQNKRADRRREGRPGIVPSAEPERVEQRTGLRGFSGGRRSQDTREERMRRRGPGIMFGDALRGISAEDGATAVFNIPPDHQAGRSEQDGVQYFLRLTDMIDGLENLEGLSQDPYEAYWQMIELIGEGKDRGMREEDIASLPCSLAGEYSPQGSASLSSFPRGAPSEMEQCKICLCEVEAGEILRTLPCCHQYHADCIDPWIKKNAVCPTCRSDIKEGMRKG